MPIDFNVITDVRIDKSKLHLCSNTWSEKIYNMIKDTKSILPVKQKQNQHELSSGDFNQRQDPDN